MNAPLFSLVLPLLLPSAPGGGPPQEPEAAVEAVEHVCPPCGAACHFVTHAGPGRCGVCGMGLVPLASVPQVGVLLHPHVELASSTSILSVMVATEGVRAFTVADTDEPLRANDALEVRPQFALADAPALDVLVVPAGWGVHEDELVLEWVAEAAAGARYVLAVGTGNVVLARAGVLDEEEPLPVPAQWVRRGGQLMPDLAFAAEPAWRRVGDVFLARDAEAGVDAALALAAELLGEQSARAAAERLGRAWEPRPVEKEE